MGEVGLDRRGGAGSLGLAAARLAVADDLERLAQRRELGSVLRPAGGFLGANHIGQRGDVRPSLETLRELIRACGYELTFGLAAYDDSYLPHINRQLELPPAARVDRMARVAGAQLKLRERMRATPA